MFYHGTFDIKFRLRIEHCVTWYWQQKDEAGSVREYIDLFINGHSTYYDHK